MRMNRGAIEENVFDNDQTDFIKTMINQRFAELDIVSLSEKDMMEKKISGGIQIEEALGRARYHITPEDMNQSILDSIVNIASRYNPKSVLSSMTFATYAAEYGTPRLPPHIDKHDSNLTIFYQLESNVEWPLIVGQESNVLSDNEALILNTRSDIHWREPRKFVGDEYTNMIFFHFNDGTKSMLSVEDRYALPKPWFDIYNRISIEKYGEAL